MAGYKCPTAAEAFLCVHVWQDLGALELLGLPSQGLGDTWLSAFPGGTERSWVGEGTDCT